MIESYAHEVKRKRRATRFFWSLVFGFAVLLYFFFQGYYPAIDFSFRSLLSQSGSLESEPKDLIRSFGIINISTLPNDAAIWIGSGKYTNDEKRMTSYGTYELLVEKPGYLSAGSRFTIERETPYYIELLTLVETPTYRRYTGEFGESIRMGDSWGGMSASGIFLFDENFTTNEYISRYELPSLGEGYFLSGSTIIEYDKGTKTWERKSWSGSSEILRICEGNIRVVEKNLYCPTNKMVVTENGRVFTGITSLGKGYFRKDDRLIKSDRYREIPLSEREQSETLFFLFDGTFYTKSGSSIVPLSGEKGKRYSLSTSLAEIRHIEGIDTILLIFGKNNSGSFLGFYDPIGGKPERLIPFPDISLSEIRVMKERGNLLIKTKGAYLLNYHNDPNIHWIIDGEILAYNTGAALYRKDGILWRADWSREDAE